MPGWYQTAPLAEGYRHAVLRGIRAVLADPRFDGVFCDNFSNVRYPSTILKNGQPQTVDTHAIEEAFDDLARSIRQTADDAGDGHFWIVTNGVINEVSEQIADVVMIESFIYSWARTENLDDQQALDKLLRPKTLRNRGGRVMPMCYFGFSGNDIAQDARRIRRLTDQANAIFSDLLSLARPGIIASFARRNLKQGNGEIALKTLQNEVPGDLEAAREIYRV